jgi:hypothetical protein
MKRASKKRKAEAVGRSLHSVVGWLNNDIARLQDEYLCAEAEHDERVQALVRYERTGTLPREIWLEAKREGIL